MEQLFNHILSNTYYIVIAVVLIMVIVFAILKKMIKLFFYAVIVFAAYLVYVHYTGGDVKKTVKTTIETGTRTAGEIKKKVEGNEKVKEVKKAIEDKLKK